MGAMASLNDIEKGVLHSLETSRTMDFRGGDRLRVHVEVVEGERKRIQVFEGVCIAYRRRGLNASFTVRKVSYGEGVNASFHYMPPASPESRWCAAVMCAAQTLLFARAYRQESTNR